MQGSGPRASAGLLMEKAMSLGGPGAGVHLLENGADS